MFGYPTAALRSIAVLRCMATIASIAAITAIGAGCDALATQPPDPGDIMDGPLPGLSAAEEEAFVRGDAAFERPFSVSEGLGPIFNNVSCAACHSGDGRGLPENALKRFSVGDDLVPHLGGPQLQDRAIAGAEPERLVDGVQVSVRLPPPVFGVGLIEAIPEAAVLAHADPDDADGDGISGRPNYVIPADFIPLTEIGGFIPLDSGGAQPQLGRFGRKAQVSSLLLQIVKAYHEDMGITTDFLVVENRNPLASVATEAADQVADPELPEAEVRAVLAYLRLLAPPAPAPLTPDRELGQTVFHEVGCARCHLPELRTGASTVDALAFQPVRLYSDLLLHDMGEALADHRPDGDATGVEWKTAPLWGMRVMRRFLDGGAYLMHDGRASTIEEAIALHGGEAASVRDAFERLPPDLRAALLAFVEGL